MRRSENSNKTLHVTASLAHTGGGDIAHFVISFRYFGVDLWTVLDDNFTARRVVDSQYMWSAEVADDRFQNSGIELEVRAVNSNGHKSNRVAQPEEICKLA